MTQMTDPFFQTKWGWSDGDNAWGTGMNENLLKFSFLLNRRLDGIVSSISTTPASDGLAYFLTTDNHVYFSGNGVWYNTALPRGFELIMKADESHYEFNGTTLVPSSVSGSVAWADITGKPSTFTPSAHTHIIADVTGLQTALDGKVDVVSGKGLSTEDYTTTEKSKLAGISAGAEANTISSVGAGTASLVSGKVGVDLQIKSLIAGSNISFTQTGDTVTINSSTGGTGVVNSVNGYTGTVVLTNADLGSTPTTRTLTAGNGLTGGGDLSANRTFTLGTPSTISASSTNSVTGTTHTHLLSITAADIGAIDVTTVDTRLGTTGNLGTIALQNANNVTISGGIINGTSIGATTRSTGNFTNVDLNGNLTLSGSAKRILGDFNNATHSNRPLFQTSNANSSTGVGVIPNGTGTSGVFNTYSSSDASNSSLGQFYTDGTNTAISATKTGTGSYLPINFYTSGALRLNIATNGVITSNSKFVTDYTGNGTLTYTDGGMLVKSDSANQPLIGFYKTGAAGAGTLYFDAAGYFQLRGTSGSGGGLKTGSIEVDTSVTAASLNLTSTAPTLIFTDNNSPATSMLAYHSFHDNTNAEVAWMGMGAGNGEMGFSNQSRNIKFLSPVVMNSTLDVAGAITSTNGATFYNATSAVDTLVLNTGATNGVLNLQKGGVSRGLLVWDNTNFRLCDANANNRIVISNGSVQVNGLQGDGANLTNLNASNITSGTLSNSRLAFGISTSSSASTVVQRDGSGDTYQRNVFAVGGYVQASAGGGFLSDVYIANAQNPIWRFASSLGVGLSYFGGSAGYGGNDSIGIHFGTASTAGSAFIFTQAGNYIVGGNITSSGGIFSGNGSGLTSLNASALSSGTVSTSRLPVASTSAYGITQLTNSVTSLTGAIAASDTAVASAYSLAASASNTATTANSKIDTQITTPEQLFQSLGSVSGSVSITASSGVHVIATVNGNTTWTFPSPSTFTRVYALTLELTNGGSYTMTWPAGTRWAGGVAPVLTASGTDILVFTKAGSNAWRGYLSSKDNK